VTLIMAILGFVGLDHHDVDVGGVDHGGGSSLFSTKPITGFFLGFGWAGGIALDRGASLMMATAIAFGVGVAFMLVLAWVIRTVYSLRTDGTRQIKNAVGAVGTVYVTLPPSRGTGGQVIVTVSGRQETLDALNAASRSLPSGEKVKVVAVVDASTLLVEPLA
jgi:membrane protein implicated in regulation of membrane protease activity